MKQILVYHTPLYNANRVDLITFSDARHNVKKTMTNGQSEIVTGIRYANSERADCFHIVDWTSSRQKRVSHSSNSAEIIAVSDADARVYAIKTVLQAFAQN